MNSLSLQLMKQGTYMLWLLVLCSCLSCTSRQANDVPPLPVDLFSDGDLAFRRGAGLMSRVVLAAGKGSVYSHVGILRRMDDGWYVIHAVPDEPEFAGDVDRVKIEPLTRFFAGDRAVRGAVMRLVGDSLAASRAAWEALRVAERGTLFDHNYDLSDTTEMYCTELVEFAYRKVGIDLAEGRISRVDVPAFGGTYLLPDDLAANRGLQVIYHFDR